MEKNFHDTLIAAHERGHKGRDPHVWDLATDIALSNYLINDGFNAGPSAVYRADLAGLPAEEIYNILIKEAK